jgi:hypothetical protein
MTADVTFRDFAGAIMTGNRGEAARVLGVLLELEPAAADAAAAHFHERMQTEGPGFMTSAMGLRTAVTTGETSEIRKLLADCFGLSGPALDRSLIALRNRYHPQA